MFQPQITQIIPAANRCAGVLPHSITLNFLSDILGEIRNNYCFDPLKLFTGLPIDTMEKTFGFAGAVSSSYLQKVINIILTLPDRH